MSPKRNVTTRGVVIGRMQAGEGSARVLLYTEELGLVHAIAKSAREERSKLRAHLTTGTYGAFALVRGERDWRVTGVTGAKNSHFALSAAASFAEASKAKQEAVARVIGVVRSLVHGEGANHALFAVLWQFLEALPALGGDDVAPAEHRAVLAILASLGYVAPSDMDAPDIVSVINKGLMASGLI
jgi:DNA repair protein RecO